MVGDEKLPVPATIYSTYLLLTFLSLGNFSLFVLKVSLVHKILSTEEPNSGFRRLGGKSSSYRLHFDHPHNPHNDCVLLLSHYRNKGRRNLGLAEGWACKITSIIAI